MKSRPLFNLAGCLVFASVMFAVPAPARAHCDSLDGPLVKAAQKALDTQNPDLVLIWVTSSDEAEIRLAFEQTLAVRALGPEARKLADRYFFETVVRVHRAGEGAPYTGLKSGQDLGPAIPAADKALATGSLDPLTKLLTDAVEQQLRTRYNNAVGSAVVSPGDIPAGRESIRAYVEFIHYVERLYDAASTRAPGHFSETSEKR
jgi:uncharacterized protein DUF6448